MTTITTMEKPTRIKTDRHGFVRCRMCGCTEIEACEPPCGWEPGEGDLCTTCAIMMRAMLHWLFAGHHPTKASLLRELDSAAERIKAGQDPYNAHKKRRGAAI
jgi:hypothetical protein